MKDVIAAAIFNPKNELMLCRKETLDYYIFPGGKPEAKETHTETLTREIREELNCGLGRHTFIKSFLNHSPNNDVIRVHMYGADIVGTPEVSREIVELLWYRPHQKLDYPLTGTSMDVIDYLNSHGYFDWG